MNHLAHFYLSFGYESIAIGNFLADFISRKEFKTLSEDLLPGIALHRKIDDFTDTHVLVKKSTRWLHLDFSKYAPVILDIYYDFLLSKNWHRYSDMQLDTFCEDMYKILIRFQPYFPQRLSDRILMMVRHKWLGSFGSYAGLQGTFDRLNRRVRYPVDFSEASKKLQSMESRLEKEFNDFFPEAIDYIKNELNLLLRSDH
jgi:acyl carrier protein phosphodiesterase